LFKCNYRHAAVYAGSRFMNMGRYAEVLTLLWSPRFPPPVRIPLYAESCAAGSPSPAQDYVEKELDLNELCTGRRASTLFVRASGKSMRDLGFFNGDVMIVNHAEEATHGDIVIAKVNGEFAVKRLQLYPLLALLPINPSYSIVYPEELQLPGVVTCFFNSTRAHRR